MNKIIEYLQRIGFSEIEARLYMKLQKSGSLTVAELAEKAKINRTSAYSHIHSLMGKGILAKVKGSTNKIVANSPESLQALVEQRITEASKLKESFPSLVNALYSTKSPQKDVPQSEMKYYKGTGVKAIYEECLRSDEIKSYFNVTDMLQVLPENAQLFQEAFLHNPKLKILELLEHSNDSIKQMKPYDDIKRHAYKFLPPDVRLTANDILIYDGKVAIINIGDKENITGVVLENRDYYNNSVQLFDLLWRLLP